MRFATVVVDGTEQGCVRRQDGRWAPLHRLDPSLAGDLLTLIEQSAARDLLDPIAQGAEALGERELVEAGEATYRPPYRRPRKIWGIGLNYADHAGDLHEETPSQPASFIKADHTIVGPGDEIVIPHQSERTTGEGELGVVMGREASNVPPDQALDHVFGVCAVLDQTAEDILALNPRYLTRSKNFPTFFSFGPEVVTLDEFLRSRALEDVEVATFLDGAEVRRNVVGNMTHAPRDLISFHSQMMPLFPGDIISTGTPGAGVLKPGVVAEARVEGLLPLTNPVRDDAARQDPGPRPARRSAD
ncbi:fumarylacetoacetate hydrolase family protein [Nocardioides sp.]|uniref:fumarylacetoacetate hydrolase family protein n=1 Tax=Nocardioides sp. TaxID=35761 RepID=UPI002D7FFEF7|nr:fumarylacetoacetate hydrolase family protein [Nocardioides sp.]HET8960845.1 fumarylacetoacetate hydrolase family protein [Nocardioides sp.]